MARLAITFTFLFFLFSFAVAHLHDADSNPNILLPTDKSADQSATLEIEAVDVNDLVHVDPTTFVSFHPINRHFRQRRRPCRHFVRPMNHRSRQISFGNDMILSSNENNRRDPELLFRDQIIPSMALNNHHHHHHGRPNNEFMSKYVFVREKLKRPFRREEEEKDREMENGGFVKRIRKFLHHF